MQVILANLFFGGIVIYPLWIIFKRAGLNPKLAALVFIPYVGFFAAAIVLGAMQWHRAGRSNHQ